MDMRHTVRTIAILGVDGENFEVGGVYEGEARKPSWYTLTKATDREVCVEKLEEFPTHEKIRELMH